jgi:hypothetical protein
MTSEQTKPSSPILPVFPVVTGAPVAPELKTISQHTSQATLTPSALPDGCSYGYLPSKDGKPDERVIWVEFPPASPDNPPFFTRRRKLGILACAYCFSWFSCTCCCVIIEIQRKRWWLTHSSPHYLCFLHLVRQHVRRARVPPPRG